MSHCQGIKSLILMMQILLIIYRLNQVNKLLLVSKSAMVNAVYFWKHFLLSN